MAAPAREATARRNADVWASGDMPVFRANRQTGLLWLLGAPALLPIVFMAPGILTLDGGTVHQSGNDVFGTGGALILYAMLAITPLRTLTRRQWFVPLRRWYGIVFAFNIFLDAITAGNDPAFNGAPYARLLDHTFLLLGVTMTLLLIPLCVQGIWNKRTMRQLGKYWKPFQQYGTYAVWACLGIHLMLLEGFGVSHGDTVGPDSPLYRVLHQRFYDFAGCAALMIALRLPPVRRWIRARQAAGEMRLVWLVISPLAVLFCVAYAVFVNELVYKGVAAFTRNPVND